MTPDEARAILRAAYGDDPVEVEEVMCFGDCCLRSEEKKALVTLIYSEQVSGNGEPYKAKRGDAIERWLRWHRDSLPSSKIDEDWLAVDALIGDYIRHADEGTPLTEDVSGNEDI